MNRSTCVSAMIVIGVFAFALGGLRMRTATVLRDSASRFLDRQRDAQAAFHREATQVSQRYQAGELDETGWRQATEAVSTRFQTESNASGSAWVEQLSFANRAQLQGVFCAAAGITFLAAGAIVAAIRRTNAQHTVPA